MPDGLYERDPLLWADTQAGLLRRLESGERVNASIDWPNVIEEIQDVGLSDLRACRSLLLQALRHILKLHAWPGSRSARHWRHEATAFLVDAKRGYTASMRQRLLVDEIYADALAVIRAIDDETGTPNSLPENCPFTLDDLLSVNLDAMLVNLENYTAPS